MNVVFYNNGAEVVRCSPLRAKTGSGIVDVENLDIAVVKAAKVNLQRKDNFLLGGVTYVYGVPSLSLESRVADANGLDVGVYQTYTFPNIMYGDTPITVAVYRTTELTAEGVRVRDLGMALELDGVRGLSRQDVQVLLSRYKCGRVRQKKVRVLDVPSDWTHDQLMTFRGLNVSLATARVLLDEKMVYQNGELSIEDMAVLVPTVAFKESNSGYWNKISKL